MRLGKACMGVWMSLTLLAGWTAALPAGESDFDFSISYSGSTIRGRLIGLHVDANGNGTEVDPTRVLLFQVPAIVGLPASQAQPYVFVPHTFERSTYSSGTFSSTTPGVYGFQVSNHTLTPASQNLLMMDASNDVTLVFNFGATGGYQGGTATYGIQAEEDALWPAVNTFVSFTEVPAPLTITSVSPDHGPSTVPISISIHGSHFTGATEVHFGTSPVAFHVADDTEIVANLGPSATTGFVDVTVRNGQGAGNLFHAFDSFAPPRELGRPCSTAYLTWSGAPCLGQSYTVTTQNLGSASQVLLVDWSNLPGNTPPRRPVPSCSFLIAPDSILALGNLASYTFSIPSDLSLVGHRLRTQAKLLSAAGATTQVLEARIGE